MNKNASPYGNETIEAKINPSSQEIVDKQKKKLAAKYYNRGSKPLIDLNLGDTVLIRPDT